MSGNSFGTLFCVTSFGESHGPALGGVHGALPAIPQLVLALIVQVVGGSRFYRGAWSALRSGSANMDVLVALGTSAALAASIVLALSQITESELG